MSLHTPGSYKMGPKFRYLDLRFWLFFFLVCSYPNIPAALILLSGTNEDSTSVKHSDFGVYCLVIYLRVVWRRGRTYTTSRYKALLATSSVLVDFYQLLVLAAKS